MVRGKPLPFDVIREIKRLGAEGKSINTIRASLRARGVKVGRSTISQYVRGVRPEAKPEAEAKAGPVAPVEKRLPQPSQPAFDPEVVEWYEELKWSGEIPKEWTIFDFANAVLAIAKRELKEKKVRDEFGRDVLSTAVKEGTREVISRMLAGQQKKSL